MSLQQFMKLRKEKHRWNKTKKILTLIKFSCNQANFCEEIKRVLNQKVV